MQYILMACNDCKNQQGHVGTVHISCGDPPLTWVEIEAGHGVTVEERKISAESLVKAFKETADTSVTARLMWRDSGIFPLEYDGNTVMACTNHEKGPKTDVNQFKALAEMIKNGRLSVKVGTMTITKPKVTAP